MKRLLIVTERSIAHEPGRRWTITKRRPVIGDTRRYVESPEVVRLIIERWDGPVKFRVRI